MKANELMIGDWVWYDNQPYQIRQLGIFGENRDGDDYPAVCVGKPNGIGLIIERNEIEPIFLNPKIFEKNEFEGTPVGDLYIEMNLYDKYAIELFPSEGSWLLRITDKTNKYSIGCNKINVYIKYLHQLQHALKLCGIDKTIEL